MSRVRGSVWRNVLMSGLVLLAAACGSSGSSSGGHASAGSSSSSAAAAPAATSALCEDVAALRGSQQRRREPMERADRQLEICPDQAPDLSQYARHGTKRQQRIRSGYRDRGGAHRGAPAPDRGQLTLPVGISVAHIQLNDPGGEKVAEARFGDSYLVVSLAGRRAGGSRPSSPSATRPYIAKNVQTIVS
jgi:hypothetical protein